MALFTELPVSAQTAYAQLLEAALGVEHFRTVADLRGSFASKTVKKRKFWYYQYTEPAGKVRQIFVGPDSDVVRALVHKKNDPSAMQRVGMSAKAAAAYGCTQINSRQMRVIERLSEYGFFRAGGVLIGTHAFLAYGNMLGVKWGDSSHTQDIDFAHAGKSISLLLPSDFDANIHAAVESLQMGFLPMTGITSKAGASYLIPNEPEFKLDFLTTLHRGRDEPFKHEKLGITLQPMKFMEYSLEDIRQAVLFYGSTAVVVNVPSPERYALHKLIVAGERKGTFAIKAGKDLSQAAMLISRLREHHDSDLRAAWDDLISRGPGWMSRVKHGLSALYRKYPELSDLLTVASEKDKG